ncbi:MAG: PilC/PilY family type IV pilus protein [Desulfatiglandales bacterium]
MNLKYFMQEPVEAELDYANNVIPLSTAAQDPFNNPDPVHCAGSYVLLLTDGASTKDLYIPDALKGYAGDASQSVSVFDSATRPDGRLQAQAGSDTDKTFYLNYIDEYPSGTTPFNDDYIGKSLVLYDSQDNQIYSGEITGVNYYDSVSGTSEIMVSGTTSTPEWTSGASPYTYDLFWKVVEPLPNDESGGLSGSEYLIDLALYARVNDLRDDLFGDQNLYLYTVYAFGDDPSARNLLRQASKYGGFEDKNSNRRPDLEEEWDAAGDGEPDTFYEASDGYLLEKQILRAINDILRRAASGTAVSVLATSGEGEGNLVQAFFRPSVLSGTTEITWAGYLQSLWVDQFGNLREDTDGDLAMDVTEDRIVSYFMDSEDGHTKIRLFDVSATTPYPDKETAEHQVVDIDGINPLWEAGSLLAERSADDRKIFTYVDMDKDGAVYEPGDDPFDDTGEVIRFHASGAADAIKPYLGVRDDATWDYLGATHDDRVHNLIEYIRGKEHEFSGTTTMLIRSRILESDVWKLGDIVHSTPVAVSKPPENYHIIYSDQSYQKYYDAYKDRETVVYVGANDGMLHAFTSWQYSGESSQYTKPSAAPPGENIGDELWAYIPQSVLPHLKWLPYWDYTHTYYVDLKPKVFDAKIFPNNTHYTDPDGEDNWGTILLMGLNMGGKQICSEDWFDDGTGTTVYETRTFHPSYVAIDITQPRDPKLLWERTYQDLDMTMSVPAVVKVKDEWYAVFGSGPETYDGTTSKKGHIYVVDLKTGDSIPNLDSFGSGVTNAWLFETSEDNAFMNSPVTLDKELNNNVDAIYFGQTYMNKSWLGKVYRVGIPWDWSDPETYVADPNDLSSPWTFSTLVDTPGPITASLSLSIDDFDNAWVYGGTGRYLSESDKLDTETQYLFGLVDPFFNAYYDSEPDDYYHDYTKARTLDFSTDLFNADPYIITSSGTVYDDSFNVFGSWDDLVDTARTYDGWRRTLEISGERSLDKITLLGGIAFAPSFLPNDDICEFGGDSFLYGLYFETGTPYYKSVFKDDTETIIVEEEGMDIEYERLLGRISLGEGKSSPLGVHVGREEGAKAFVQQSTGAVIEEDITPAFNVKSGLISWREK